MSVSAVGERKLRLSVVVVEEIVLGVGQEAVGGVAEVQPHAAEVDAVGVGRLPEHVLEVFEQRGAIAAKHRRRVGAERGRHAVAGQYGQVVVHHHQVLALVVLGAIEASGLRHAEDLRREHQAVGERELTGGHREGRVDLQSRRRRRVGVGVGGGRVLVSLGVLLLQRLTLRLAVGRLRRLRRRHGAGSGCGLWSERHLNLRGVGFRVRPSAHRRCVTFVTPRLTIAGRRFFPVECVNDNPSHEDGTECDLPAVGTGEVGVGAACVYALDVTAEVPSEKSQRHCTSASEVVCVTYQGNFQVRVAPFFSQQYQQ